MTMNIRLCASKYLDSVFVAVLGSGGPEPVLVALLTQYAVNESIKPCRSARRLRLQECP